MFSKSVMFHATLLIVALCSSVFGQFWYSDDGSTPLGVDSTKVLIKFEPGLGTDGQDQLLSEIGRIVDIIEDDNVIDGFAACSLTTGSGYDSFLDSLSALTGIYLVEPYYLSASGYPMLVGEHILVAFDTSSSGTEIDSINAANKVVVDRELIGMPNVYSIRNTDSTGTRLVELANMYHLMEQTQYAQPDFSASIATNSYTLYDYYHQYQPHTKKVVGQFNSASVWDFAGLNRSVSVAVVDDGTTNHEDLPSARILDGCDFGGHWPNYVHDNDPSPGPDRYHGMATAGIIAASHATTSSEGNQTSSGMISMDPFVDVLPVKIFNDSGNATGLSIGDIADAINYARTEGADILSNSWSFTDPSNPGYPAITQACEFAYYFGRDGRGCPVIFSSGNTRWPYTDPNGVAYPSRLDECFAVGAITLTDTRWGYSRYGPELDMVAPSDDGNTVGVWSLDQMDNLGRNPTYMSDCPPGANDVDYVCHFGGTSAACPLVAGTAALLLAKDSTLSAQAVYYILRNSAVTDLDWGTITPPHTQYGYGRVDAFRAILSISRGDVNNDYAVDISDLIWLVDYMFSGGSPPFPSVLLADVNCSGDVDISDLMYLTDYMFSGGPPPINPCFEFE